MSAGLATKLYTQIRLGRASPGWLIGVCWVTLVEAHPVTTNSASKQITIRLLDLITNLLVQLIEPNSSGHTLIQLTLVNALVYYGILSFLFFLHVGGRRRYRDCHFIDRAGEFVVAFL